MLIVHYLPCVFNEIIICCVFIIIIIFFLFFKVIRGIRKCRPGLVETAHQYEACHLILEGVLSGPPAGGKGGKRKKEDGRKWNPFRKKSLVGLKKTIVISLRVCYLTF